MRERLRCSFDIVYIVVWVLLFFSIMGSSYLRCSENAWLAPLVSISAALVGAWLFSVITYVYPPLLADDEKPLIAEV